MDTTFCRKFRSITLFVLFITASIINIFKIFLRFDLYSNFYLWTDLKWTIFHLWIEVNNFPSSVKMENKMSFFLKDKVYFSLEIHLEYLENITT